ncbi:Chemotaxis regulator - transmits chemoreceptor signals to flagelllar motor components CheY [Marinobacterium lacunae]|uniref:Chemotaxis regulator-transmits chemoreceptor signals to flagelllar motor components CheY n=1 Tax=Marinobacterium lacunae TaxID=1232683 RepID=A0A081FV14_9GAMM|nr:response regulator [Marinobacterium lacunae]KEA62369.1 Chemotaxis regulator - transmits chemoreceptor signals to flagelllar motor components CheY [Marinobacterium lacunae]MBR9885020.1 response regulator [Oceanospirillales bacterium]
MKINDLLVQVIEPSRVQRHIIIDSLRQLGIHDIEDFESAEPALARMQVVKPDIVMSSMHLPDMTGTELVIKMREQPDLADITFLLVSTETHYRYLEPIRQAGAIAILPKPFSRSDLMRALQSTMHYISDRQQEEEDDLFDDMSVLLVDDSALSRKFVHQVLSAAGIQHITEAKDGAEALQFLATQSFDLVISDYNMPNIDGLELVDHIRNHSTQPTVPVMMITSEQNSSRLAAIQSAGVSALCSKPLSYDMVKQLIQQLVADRDI